MREYNSMREYSSIKEYSNMSEYSTMREHSTMREYSAMRKHLYSTEFASVSPRPLKRANSSSTMFVRIRMKSERIKSHSFVYKQNIVHILSRQQTTLYEALHALYALYALYICRHY